MTVGFGDVFKIFSTKGVPSAFSKVLGYALQLIVSHIYCGVVALICCSLAMYLSKCWSKKISAAMSLCLYIAVIASVYNYASSALPVIAEAIFLFASIVALVAFIYVFLKYQKPLTTKKKAVYIPVFFGVLLLVVLCIPPINALVLFPLEIIFAPKTLF